MLEIGIKVWRWKYTEGAGWIHRLHSITRLRHKARDNIRWYTITVIFTNAVNLLCFSGKCTIHSKSLCFSSTSITYNYPYKTIFMRNDNNRQCKLNLNILTFNIKKYMQTTIIIYIYLFWFLICSKCLFQCKGSKLSFRHKTPKWHRFASIWVLATRSLSCTKKFLCCDWMKYINDLMSAMAYIMTFHACVKIDVNYLHVRKWLTSLDMVNFDNVNSIFSGTFMLLETP